jgi:ABC-type nitrate/sulfonate/bicarbonate transport system substrate-binding protein
MYLRTFTRRVPGARRGLAHFMLLILAIVPALAACTSAAPATAPTAAPATATVAARPSPAAATSASPAVAASVAPSLSAAARVSSPVPAPSPAAAAAPAAAAPLPTGPSTPAQLGFNADGTPNLKGLTIHLGNSAGDATVGDTVVYVVSETLKQWGASVDFQLGNGNTTEQAVVSGQLDATAGPLTTCVDAGLNIFGNNQVHVDYLLVSPTYTSVDQLKGKTVGIAQTTAPDAYLLDGALQNAGMTKNDVNIVVTGSNSASVNQVLLGKLDATFVHADALLTLDQNGRKFNVIANSAQVQPWNADSYMCAKPDWLKANAGTAEAIDLAWLHAAKMFDTNKSEWVKAAVQYTQGATSESDASAAYDALAQATPWPDDGSGMEPDTLQKNFDNAKQQGEIKGLGDRTIDQWSNPEIWAQAVQVYKSHANAY